MASLARNFVFAFLFSCLTCGALWAQVTAQISGTVKDASGAVLPGVEVTATQTATGLVRTAVSNETGSYILPNLPVGPYKLEAALAGFRTFVQTGIVLQVDANPVLNVTLEVGQVSETVEVQADDGRVAKVTLLQQLDGHEVRRELSGDELIVASNQGELSDGQAVRAGEPAAW